MMRPVGCRSKCPVWVNHVGWALSVARRLRPQLRTYHCIAANRRFGPRADPLH